MGSIQGAAIRFLLKKSNMWNKPLDQIRADMAKIKGNGTPKGVHATREELNGVACEVFKNESSKNDKIIIYYHGGGFCLGIYHSNSDFVAGIAQNTGAKVYMPDYRLAPEYPFPAALDDAVSIYQSILDKASTAKNIIIMGDSSGCALALSALLVLKHKGVSMPGAFIGLTPVFDLAGTGESFTSKADKDPFQLKDPLSLAKIYIGDNDPASQMLSPLYGNLIGLPPMLIHAGEYDVFQSDSIRLTEKLHTANVKVELKVWKKMWHIFHMQAAIVPEAKNAMKEIYSYIHTLY